MNNKYRTAFRTLMLMLVSSGIFISSFHSHSGLEWIHNQDHCTTGRHLADHNPFCPICSFRLGNAPSEPASPLAIQNVISVIHETANSIADELFTAPLTGRSPPALS